MAKGYEYNFKKGDIMHLESIYELRGLGDGKWWEYYQYPHVTYPDETSDYVKITRNTKIKILISHDSKDKIPETKQGNCNYLRCDRTSVKLCSYCGEPFCMPHLMQRDNEVFCYDCDTGVASIDRDSDSEQEDQGESD